MPKQTHAYIEMATWNPICTLTKIHTDFHNGISIHIHDTDILFKRLQ